MTHDSEHDFSDSHLIRHCRYLQTDKKGFPLATAFLLRDGEQYLSFCCMEKICAESNIAMEQELSIKMKSAVRSLERTTRLRLSNNQLWAILHCNDIRSAIEKVTNRLPAILSDPNPTNSSHTQVWFNKLHRDAVANELHRRLGRDRVFPVQKQH